MRPQNRSFENSANNSSGFRFCLKLVNIEEIEPKNVAHVEMLRVRYRCPTAPREESWRECQKPTMLKGKEMSPDLLFDFLIAEIRRALSHARERCDESLKALSNEDFLLALGAITGIAEKVQTIRTNLLLLQQFSQWRQKQVKEEVD
jgi:hypothetical protein